jgi:hypothetical protein
MTGLHANEECHPLFRYVSSRHSDEAYVHFKRGFMSGTCGLDTSKWKKGSFPGWNEDMLWQGFLPLPRRSGG